MSIDYAGFRRELESFVRDACPHEIRAVVAAGQKITKREYQAWQKILATRGWGAPSWPVVPAAVATGEAPAPPP